MARLSIQLDELIVWPPYFIQIDFDVICSVSIMER